MILGIVAVVVIVGATLFGLGVKSGTNGNPKTVAPPDRPSIQTCQEACAAWDNARQMQCNAKADEDAARARADSIRTEMLAFIAAAISLAAGAAATLVAAGVATATFFGIPLGVILTGIAIGLAVASGVASAAADVLAGQLVAAETDYGAKANARRGWDTEVANDRGQINLLCSIDEANACLSRSTPC